MVVEVVAADEWSYSYVVSSALSDQVGTSPPEAAIEATPETTPVKDPRLYSSSKVPASSNVVRVIGSGKWHSSSSTPSSSQPSSPMKKEVSPFRFPDTSADSNLLHRKIQSVVQDRLNVHLKTPSVNGNKLDESAELSHDDQDDQEVLEFSQQGEWSISSNQMASARQCDSVLLDYHPPSYHPCEDDLEQCERESGSSCSNGGLHTPSSRSMQTFRHRLRYYSQCGQDLGCVRTSEPEESTSVRDTLGVSSVVRRAHSCPEMKKTRPGFTGPENNDENLDETLELESNMVTVGTQTASADMTPPQPYEHMFLSVFPSPPSDTEPQAAIRCDSPTTTLVKYLEKALSCRSEEPTPKRTLSTVESELKAMKDQLTLLHLQLKFERHRRDIHDQRNRRLLGKSRQNRALEEHNSALRDQLNLLVKEIDNLHEEMRKNNEQHSSKEKSLQEAVDFWQDKCTNLEKQNRELKSENGRLLLELNQNNQHNAVVAKRLQHVEAQLFTVGKELKEATTQASAGESLKRQLAYLHKELVAMGEHYVRTRDMLSKVSVRSGKATQLCQDSFVEQVRGLNSQLDAKITSCESLKTRIAELEAVISRKEQILAEHKRALKAVKDECREELEAVETKYKSQLATNRKLETHILELTCKLEVAARRSRRNVSAAQDALTLADRGGLNSPLSLSLSSSEGHSLTSIPAFDSILSRDLQAIVDSEASRIPELLEFEDIPRPSSSHD